jgi:hypothetical protein
MKQIINAEQLRINRYVYEYLLSRYLSSFYFSAEAKLRSAETVAGFAMMNHTGLLSDGRLENSLLSINLPRATASIALFSSRENKRRVLHVATRVMRSGGHSRVLDRWLRSDRNSSHAVVLTSQLEDIPQFISATSAEFDIPIIKLPVRSRRVRRAADLRWLSQQADIVVLHQHPEDSIPLCAFSTMNCPPVIFWNHAHYWFSFGPTIADVTMNAQEYFGNLSKKFRYSRQQSLIRGVTGIVCESIPNKASAKQELGFSPASKILLAMGNPSYFTPVPGTDFFSAVDRVLDRDTTAELLLVGPDADSPYVAAMRNKNRVRACGMVADPVPYYVAADYVLESFPHTSTGSFLEAICIGNAFPIAAFSAEEHILSFKLDQFEGDVPRTRTANEWVETVCNALSDLDLARLQATRISHRLREADRKFPESIEAAYSLALSGKHNPGPIGKGIDIPDVDALVLVAQSYASLESFNLIRNPLTRWMAKRRAAHSGLPGRLSLTDEVQLTSKHLANAISRIWRFQLRARITRLGKTTSRDKKTDLYSKLWK